MTEVRFIFDYISPYAYLAWTQVHAVAARHGAVVEAVPALFAALLDANGQKGPAEIPAKRAYLFTDCARTAHRLGVVIAPPPAHPFNPLLALRVTCAVPAAARRPLVDALFAETWGGGAGVTEPSHVARVATKAGFDGAALVAAASQGSAKSTLRAYTTEALRRGAFGVPTMLVGEDLFWGLDSLPNLELVLAGQDPVRPEDLARWSQLPASAERKR